MVPGADVHASWQAAAASRHAGQLVSVHMAADVFFCLARQLGVGVGGDGE